MARIMKAPEERKQEIVEAALDLLIKKGYDNTTIQDIAEKLHIAQGQESFFSDSQVTQMTEHAFLNNKKRAALTGCSFCFMLHVIA